MAVSEETLICVYQTLSGIKDGEVAGKALELATHYGVSIGTIYRWAAKKGLRWREESATKGKTRVPDQTLKDASAMLYASRRKSNEIPLPACDAIEMLEDSGIKIDVSVSRFRRLLRQRNISAKDLLMPAPHVILLSKHPNHVWQFDVTNCIQYFLDSDGGLGEREPDFELYKNKIVKTAKEIKKELLRYVMVDHCTGAFYFRYFYASGERAIDGSQFFFETMRPKDEQIRRVWNGDSESKIGKYHFHGVPFVLVCDRGSIAAAKANQALLDALRVELKPHMPGNPRAKGAVEGLMHMINRFEGRLKFQRPRDLGELNLWALDWCIMVNAVKDIRGIAPRSALWSTIRPEQLRLCPEEGLFKLLIREPAIRRRATGSRLISIDNMIYQIPDPNCVHQWVEVVRHPYEYPAVEVHSNGHVWLLRPIEKDQYGRLTVGVPYGEYRATKQTETQAAKKEMEKIAEGWGLTWKGTGDKRIAVSPPVGHVSPLKVFGHQADKVRVEFIERPGTRLEIRPHPQPENRTVAMDAQVVSRSIVKRNIPFIAFLSRLKEVIGPISPEMNRALRSRYGDSIESNEAEEVIREAAAGRWPSGGAQDKPAIEAAG